MSRNAIAFIAGLGTGYLNQTEKNKDRERQDKKDAQDAELFDAKMTEIKDAQKLKQGLADAGAERTAIDGTVVDTGNGKNLYADPAQAATATADARIEAEMRGQDPAKVTSMAGQGITGKMALGHQITTSPVDLAKLNSIDARNQRNAAVMYGAGKPVEAMQLESAAKNAKLTDLSLSNQQRVEERDIANSLVMKAVQKHGGDAVPAAVEMLTQAGGQLEGYIGKSVISPDGKTRSIIGTKDGVEKVYMTTSNDEAGSNQVLQRLLQLDPKTVIDLGFKNREEARLVKKDDQTQTNWNKTFDLTKSHQQVMEGIAKGNLSIAQMTAGLAKAKEAREQTLFNNEIKIPTAEKTQLAMLSKHMDIIEKAMAESKAKDTWNPDSPGSKDLILQYDRASAQYTKTITPFMGASKKASGPGDDPLGLRVAPPATPATPDQAPSNQAASGINPAVQAPTNTAPVRTTNGGKTYFLDIPENIRDPSVPYYQPIANPAFKLLGQSSFSSHADAEKAFRAISK